MRRHIETDFRIFSDVRTNGSVKGFLFDLFRLAAGLGMRKRLTQIVHVTWKFRPITYLHLAIDYIYLSDA